MAQVCAVADPSIFALKETGIIIEFHHEFQFVPQSEVAEENLRLLFGNVHLLSRFSSFAHPSIHKPPMFIDKVSLFPLPVRDKKCISANGAPATRTISIP